LKTQTTPKFVIIIKKELRKTVRPPPTESCISMRTVIRMEPTRVMKQNNVIPFYRVIAL
jgi:hypothetical protein